MFIGSIKREVCTQLVKNCDFGKWEKIFIGCSGSFRSESVIGNYFKDVLIFSNDVSFLSCAIGYAATKRNFSAKYSGELEFLSKFNSDDPIVAIAAAGIALEYGAASEKNKFGRNLRHEIISQVDNMFNINIENARKLVSSLRVEDFYPGDFKEQLTRAKEQSGGFISFAPTYRGGYEKIYTIINKNIEWEAPQYDIWDPKKTPELIDKCYELGIPFAILTDKLFTGYKPSFVFSGSGHTVYIYGQEKSSLRCKTAKIQPFRYTPINPNKISQYSKVDIVQVDNNKIAFLKTIYLSKNIKFASGDINFLVFIDNMLTGGITISKTQYGDKYREIYILSDFTICHEKKLAKLIAMIATSRGLINILNRKWLIDIEKIFTTAFTNKPVSMKYRGIFKIYNKKPGMINYVSSVREGTPQDIFKEWWKKYGQKS